MAKSKKMAVGGAAMGAIGKSPQMQFMSNALRGGAMKPPGGAPMQRSGAAPQMQFMSDKLRGAPMQGAGPAPVANPAMMAKSGPPSVAPGAPKMMGGMNKGGAVKSASARADGIAQRGKTRGMMK